MNDKACFSNNQDSQISKQTQPPHYRRMQIDAAIGRLADEILRLTR
jgi:hypothetical protein